MYEEFTDEEIIEKMNDLSLMELIGLIFSLSDDDEERERLESLVEKVIQTKDKGLIERYEYFNKLSEEELRTYNKETDQLDDMVIADILQNYIPNNEEVMKLISLYPDLISVYKVFFNENESKFPFLIELFINNEISLPIIENYLIENKSTYNYLDILTSLQKYMTNDPYLPTFFRMVMDIYGVESLPEDYISKMLLLDDLSTNLEEFLKEILPLSKPFAKKPYHILINDDFDPSKLPVLSITTRDEEEIVAMLPTEEKEILENLDEKDKSFVIDSARLNIQEILTSKDLDMWFGMINPGVGKTLINPFIPSIDDIDDPETKYGRGRMLLSNNNPVEDEYFESFQSDWFTGSCQQSKERIAFRHYAVRRPLARGDWYGCFSSWEYVTDNINDLIDEYIFNYSIPIKRENIDDLTREELEAIGSEHPYIMDRLYELDLVVFFSANTTIIDRDENGQPSMTTVTQVSKNKGTFRKKFTRSTVTVYSGPWEEATMNPIENRTISDNI